MYYLKKIVKYFLNENGYYNVQDYSDKYRASFKNYLYVILLLYIKDKSSFNFIQVGANDGITGDPLFFFTKKNKKKIRAIFFEPQIRPFKKLVTNYSDCKNFYFINKAVGPEGKFPFYSLNKRFQKDFSRLAKSYYIEGLSSFYINNLNDRFKKYKNFDPKRHISTEILQTSNILKEIKINLKNKSHSFLKQIDLLQIDTEGYDDSIIYSCNLDILKPVLIHFEHKNLLSEKIIKLKKYLQKKNYDIYFYSKTDGLAMRKY
jgi:FkbM family methyltransferase